MANFLGSLFGHDFAIDLGTTMTVIYERGGGIVLREPSVVAVRDGEPVAIGTEAKSMLGRVPADIDVLFPLQDGVISEFELCEQMLRFFVDSVAGRRLSRPKMVVAVPSGISAVEMRAVQEAAEFAGAAPPVQIIDEAMAAAIGSRLAVERPAGNMIVDVGGGTTQTAVISLLGVVSSSTTRVGGNAIDHAIINYLRHQHRLHIGKTSAELIKIQHGYAVLPEHEEFGEVRGRDVTTGLPSTATVSSHGLSVAIDEPVSSIVATVVRALDKTPPELTADIFEDGITLTGGTANLTFLDERISRETQMPSLVVECPEDAVAVGAGMCLEQSDVLRGVFRTTTRV